MDLNKRVKNLEVFFTEKRLLLLLLFGILGIDITILIFSEGFSGGPASITHYIFSRWAFSNPKFLLNLGTNPTYTLISAPMALLGFKALQFFNILIGIASGYIAFLVAKELKMKSPLLALVICSFTPIFMLTLFSGLSEILFAFATILATYLLIKDKFSWGSIIVSLLPFIKPEGFILIPIYAIYVANRKQYAKMLYLLTGTFLYSIIGFIAGKGFFWIFNSIPLHTFPNSANEGGFFDFILRSPGFFGIPNEIFFITGLVAGLSLYFREKKEYSREFLLIVMPFIVYFLFHSLSWWLGIGGSLGLKRYMAAIVPLMAVMATRGLYLFAKMFLIIFKREWIKVAALIIAFLSVFHIPFAVQNYPIPLGFPEKTIKSAADWIKVNTNENEKIFYYDPAIIYFLDINPLDSTKSKHKVYSTAIPAKNLNNGDIVLYDSYLSEADGLRFTTLLHNPEFELLAKFDPEVPTSVNGHRFFVALFKKVPTNNVNIENNNAILNADLTAYKPIFTYDFDKKIYKPEKGLISTSSINKSKYFRIKKHKEFSLTNEFLIDTLNPKLPLKLKIDFTLFSKTPDDNLIYVIEASKEGKAITYKKFDIYLPSNSNPDEWNNQSYIVTIPEINEPNAITIKLYFWNKRKGEYLIDNYSVSYLSK